MEQIQTYIINLKRSPHRKEYMKDLLNPYPFINQTFLEAVDGRLLTENEISNCYDDTKTTKRYGRSLNVCEIGCTMSHRKCLENICSNNYDFALILEDDISIVEELSRITEPSIFSILKRDTPSVVCLSGDYWFWNKQNICRLYDASGAYAYMINKSAATLILESLPHIEHVADDWDLYKKLGIKLYALNPHVIDANIAGIPSDINQAIKKNNRSKMSLKAVVQSYQRAVIKRMLYLIKHFHAKTRKPNYGITNDSLA